MHYLQSVGLQVLEVVLPTLATALAGLLVAVLARKLQSLGITVSEQQAEQLKALAAHTVIALEEQAHRQPMTGATKDAIAVATIQQKLPDAKPDDVRLAIDAALPAAREVRTPPKPTTVAPITPGTFGRT